MLALTVQRLEHLVHYRLYLVLEVHHDPRLLVFVENGHHVLQLVLVGHLLATLETFGVDLVAQKASLESIAGDCHTEVDRLTAGHELLFHDIVPNVQNECFNGFLLLLGLLDHRSGDLPQLFLECFLHDHLLTHH